MAEAQWVKHPQDTYRLMAGAVSVAIVFPAGKGYEWRMSMPRPMPGERRELRTKGFGKSIDQARVYATKAFHQWCQFAGAEPPAIELQVIDAQSYWSGRDH